LFYGLRRDIFSRRFRLNGYVNRNGAWQRKNNLRIARFDQLDRRNETLKCKSRKFGVETMFNSGVETTVTSVT
jgi:hypothetical protein